MACDPWTYESIKTKIVGQKISHGDLNRLKIGFAREIGSKRRMSHITNLGDLLDILEKRDVINPANVYALEDICYYLRNECLIDAISHYKPEKNWYLTNEYALERIQHQVQGYIIDENTSRGQLGSTDIFEKDRKTLENSRPTPLAQTLSSKTRDKVCDLIAKEIGRKWRDFGREIKFREGEMDELQAKYPRDSKTRVRKMLDVFEEDERVVPKKMVSCICTALTKCRRENLRAEIEDLLTR